PEAVHIIVRERVKLHPGFDGFLAEIRSGGDFNRFFLVDEGHSRHGEPVLPAMQRTTNDLYGIIILPLRKFYCSGWRSTAPFSIVRTLPRTGSSLIPDLSSCIIPRITAQRSPFSSESSNRWI